MSRVTRSLARVRQRGLVSIMVTMVFMTVISLIVLGFAQVSRREQRENLDRKLSTQAFLAAETGINDARKHIEADLAGNNPVTPKPLCKTTPAAATYKFDPEIDAANEIEYTCLLVDPTVDDLVADISPGSGAVALNVDPAGASIANLEIRWHAKNPPTPGQVANCGGVVPSSGAWKSIITSSWLCPYGALRIDIVPTDTLGRTALEAGQRTMFLYPLNLGGMPILDYNTADGRIAGMNCDVNECRLTVTNLSGHNTYGVRVSSFYVGGDIRLVATNAGGNPIEIENSQVIIDSTGKAQDVLRRVQVRLPILSNRGTAPDFALESASSICKRFQSTGTTLQNANDFQGQDPNNPMCVTYGDRPAGGIYATS